MSLSESPSEEANIFIHEQDISLTDFSSSLAKTFESWIHKCSAFLHADIEEINYIFCSDNALHQLNLQHLQHDTFTDILTFPYHTPGEPLESDIYISLDRVKENASIFNSPFDVELRRVMAHGLLHLTGHDDHSAEDKARMRSAEDELLSL
jgi:rRNA maturation RNase YbeY